jgi:predicted nucleotidyltransferase
VKTLPPTLSPDELCTALRAFCEQHAIRRLDVFGSAARGQASLRSDVDVLVMLDDSVPVSTLEILDMAGANERAFRRDTQWEVATRGR